METTPRIGYDDLPAVVRGRVEPRVARLGYLGEFFQVAAHQPEALVGFIDFTEALKSSLDWRLVEAVAFTVAARCENEYELVQHQRLASTLGMDEAQIRALSSGRPEEGDLDSDQLAAVRLAEDVVAARGGSCADSYEALQREVGVETAVGCLMTAVRYLAHATMSNTWDLRPPVTASSVMDSAHA
jgi:alkylhydroperoxidase family enzyme